MRVMTATRLVQARLGEGSVWVEAVVPPGTEPAGVAVAQKVLDAFDAAGDVLSELAVKVAASVDAIGQRARRPDEVAVEFGLRFATTGSVIVASGSAGASLVVTITYRTTATPPDTPPDGPPDTPQLRSPESS